MSIRVVVLTPEEKRQYEALCRDHELQYKAEREADKAIGEFIRRVTKRTSEEYARISDDGGFFVVTRHMED